MFRFAFRRLGQIVGFKSLELMIGKQVRLTGRVHNVRVKGNLGFLVMREEMITVQCCIFKSSSIDKEKIKELGNIPNESIVEVSGTVAKTQKKTSCSVNDLEVLIENFHVLSKAEPLPFSYEEGLNIDRVSLKTRLDHRVMDLRLPLSHSLMKAKSQVSNWFREYLLKKEFIEIHSPKLIEGVSEGGSEVFVTDYFGKPACLAQSPQLFKQIAVLSDFPKVFEVGPVFRAENSNTHRHLCEFTGLDLETRIESSYLELIELVSDLLLFLFQRLESEESLNLIYSHFGTESIKYSKTSKVLMTYEEASELLRSSGIPHSFPEDFSLEQEKLLGALIKQKYLTDFYIIHRYPTSLRPLYTKPCKTDPRYSESFDFFIRGEEIASGSRRISDYQELLSSVISRKVETKSIQFYLDCFKYGSPDHGGCGLGLERLIMLYFGVNNIRYASMFPRDPRRLVP